MCTGIELAGIAAAVGGGAINSKIQNDAIGEQNRQNQIATQLQSDARNKENTRQKELEASQAEEVVRALFASDPESIAATAEAEAVDPTNDIVASADVLAAPELQGQLSGGEISEGIGKIVADAARKTKGILKAQSTLTSQGTGLSGIQDALTRMGSNVSTVNSNRRGSLGAARLETSLPAATVTPSSSILGDLLLLGGTAVSGGLGGGAGGLFKRGAPKMANVGDVFGAPLLAASTLPAVY